MQGKVHVCQLQRIRTDQDTRGEKNKPKRTKRIATTHSISYLLNRLDIITRNKLVVSVEELNTGFFESALREQKPFDARKACKQTSEETIMHT
jgi:hypothetical protein